MTSSRTYADDMVDISHDEIKSSPPPRLEPNHFDKEVDRQFDEVGHEPLESPLKPDSLVQLSRSYEYGERTHPPQGRPQDSPIRVRTPSPRRPYPVLGSPYRFAPRQAENDLEDNDSDWSSDYGSPLDAATHYLPSAMNNNDQVDGSSPYRHVREHYSLSVVKNQLEYGKSLTPITMMSTEVIEGWSSLYHATAPDRGPLSTVKNWQAVQHAHTPDSGYSSPYEDEPEHLPLGYMPNRGTEHQSESKLAHTPHYGSKLRFTLRSSSPHEKEDHGARDEWNELPIRGSHSTSIKYALLEDSLFPHPKVRRSRKSRMTSYGHVGGSRVFTEAFKDPIDDEAEVLERARKMPFPESLTEEGACEGSSRTRLQGFATDFAAHHNPSMADDEPEKSRTRPLQSRASRSAQQHLDETTQTNAPTRDLSGATIVPSVEGKPQGVDEELVMLVEYEVPASYQVEKQAQCTCKANVQDTVVSPSQSVLPCAETESCASRVARLEQQSERLAGEIETLREQNGYLRLLAVGASCLLMGGTLILAQLRRS